MAVNKVEANGETLIDLTNDTVRASDVLKGKTLHLASGVRVEGTYDHDSKQDTFVDLWEAEVGSAGVNELDIDELSDFIENYSTLLVTISNEFNNSEIINSGPLSTAYCPLTDEFMRGVDAAFVLIVVPYISDPIHYDHVLAYISILQNSSVSESKSILVTGTRNEALVVNKLTGLYLRKIVGIPISGLKLAVLSGYMPLTFPSNGDGLLNYRVYGTAEGAGEAENLFNKNANDTNNGYVNGCYLAVDNRELANDYYVISEYIQIQPSTTYYLSNVIGSGSATALCFYNANKEYISSVKLYVSGRLTTEVISPDDAVFLRTSIQVYKGYIDLAMITKSEVSEYIPFEYKIPLTVSGTETKTTDVYIGDTKLMAGDYIDYETNKIYKAKRVHEDTVTIDGIEWDILDYDHDEVYKADGTRAKHTVTIQTHDIINELQYSARQAAFAFPDGLAAGTYHFTVGAHPWVAGDINKVLTFTLANAIAAGGQLVFNGSYNATLVGTTITAFASTTSTTAAETVTMIEGNTGTDLGTILRSKTDAINSIDHALLGSNNWLESAMRQYLNSDKAAGSVWTPQSVFDRSPIWAGTTAGFLNGKSADFLSHIGTTKKITGLNNISDGGGTAVHDEKFFLLSCSEVYMGDEYTGGEGMPYAYYKNYSDSQSPSTGEDKNRIKYRAGVARYWWLRSPYAISVSNTRLVYMSGAMNNGPGVNTGGVATACCIVLDDADDWVKQTFYTETTVDLPAIETFNGDNTLNSTETLGEVTIKGKIKH